MQKWEREHVGTFAVRKSMLWMMGCAMSNLGSKASTTGCTDMEKFRVCIREIHSRNKHVPDLLKDVPSDFTSQGLVTLLDQSRER
jgi:hypothetical protein